MLLEESNLKFKVTFQRRLLFSQRIIRRVGGQILNN